MSEDDAHGANGPEEQPVIDIHPPHEAAHSWRDIAIHLATITVGLFIALSLEGCVEWQHHRHLVREARENIRSEIVDNQKDLESALNDIHEEQAQVKAGITVLSKLRQDPNAHGLGLRLGLSGTALQNASWNTSRETGALAFMRYPEVKKYAEVYDLQRVFSTETDRVTSAYADAFSVIYVFDIDDKQEASLKKDDVNAAMQKVWAVQSELMLYEATAKGLDREYTETLQKNF